MTTTHSTLASQLRPKTNEEEEEDKQIYGKLRDLVSTFPAFQDWVGSPLYKHPNHNWYGNMTFMVGAMVSQQHFEARPTDVLLVTFPKSGTTWMKALLFAITHRETCLGKGDTGNALATLNPHECVPFLEFQVYSDDKIPDMTSLPSPRLLGSHVPIQALPGSVLESRCPVIYLWRDPKDTFVSYWHFYKKTRLDYIVPIEEAFETFCDGRVTCGPYFDHVLGYWKACKDEKANILFVKYEELMENTKEEVIKLAKFIGRPFSKEEMDKGVVKDVIDLCSFEKLKNAQVNKCGETKFAHLSVKNNTFFRMGKTGDWVNHLSAEMGRRLDQITEDKFSEYNLA